MKYTLTKIEQTVARDWAEARQKTAKAQGRKSRLEGSAKTEEEEFEKQLQGTGGELIVARLLNVYPDFSDLLPGQQAHKFDLVEDDGMRIEVKTTDRPPGNLAAHRTTAAHDSDRMVSVLGKFPTYEVIGWIETENAIRPDRMDPEKAKNTGRPPFYLVPVIDLHEFNPALFKARLGKEEEAA